MRITDNWIVKDFLDGIFRSRAQLATLQLQLANQKKVNKPSDNPSGMSVILRTQAELAKVEKYQAAVDSGKAILKTSADGLDRVAGLLQDVKTLMAGATSQTDGSLLLRYADQIDSYLNLAVDIANTQFDGKYIFGGTMTTVPPFVAAGTSGLVQYKGNANPLEYQVAPGVSQAVSVTGASAFMAAGELSFDGALDRLALVGASMSTTAFLSDSFGVAHAVRVTFKKTAADTWSVAVNSPPGATDATLSGGTATITFDPTTGQVSDINREAPLRLIPTAVPPATNAAPPMVVELKTAGLSQQDGAWLPSTSYRNVSVFEKLLQIRDSLRSGTAPSEDDVYLIGLMRDHLLQETARAGMYAENLNTNADYLSGLQQHLLDVKSAAEDVDLAEVGVKLKQQETVLEAVLSSAARIIPQSLLDYLK